MRRTYRVVVDDEPEQSGGDGFLIFLVIAGLGIWFIIDNIGAVLRAIFFLCLVAIAVYSSWKTVTWVRKSRGLKRQVEYLAFEAERLSGAIIQDLDAASASLSELLTSWENIKRTRGIGTDADRLMDRYNSRNGGAGVEHLKQVEERAVTVLARITSLRPSILPTSTSENENSLLQLNGEEQNELKDAALEARAVDRELRAAIFHAVINS